VHYWNKGVYGLYMHITVKIIIKTLVSVLGISIIIFIFRNRIPEIMQILKQCDVVLVICAVIIYFCSTAMVASRLRIVFKMQDIQFNFFTVLRLSFLGYFFNMFLPTSIGGDIVKMYYAAQYSGEKAKSFTAILVDRIIGFSTLVMLSTLSVIFFRDAITSPCVFFIIVFFLCSILFTALFFSNKQFASFFTFVKVVLPSQNIQDKIKRFYALIHSCRNCKRAIVFTIFLSLLFQMIIIIDNYILARALHINLSISIFFLLIPLVCIFCLLPSINGLGIREGAFIYFFSFFTSPENAFALSLLADVLIYSVSIFGFFVYLFTGKVRYRDIKNAHYENIPVSQ